MFDLRRTLQNEELERGALETIVAAQKAELLARRGDFDGLLADYKRVWFI